MAFRLGLTASPGRLWSAGAPVRLGSTGAPVRLGLTGAQVRLGLTGAPVRPNGSETGPVVALILAALGAAVAFAPAWDSYILRTAAGATQSVTAGNAFANPGAVIFVDIAVMVGLVAVRAAGLPM